MSTRRLQSAPGQPVRAATASRPPVGDRERKQCLPGGSGRRLGSSPYCPRRIACPVRPARSRHQNPGAASGPQRNQPRPRLRPGRQGRRAFRQVHATTPPTALGRHRWLGRQGSGSTRGSSRRGRGRARLRETAEAERRQQLRTRYQDQGRSKRLRHPAGFYGRSFAFGTRSECASQLAEQGCPHGRVKSGTARQGVQGQMW